MSADPFAETAKVVGFIMAASFAIGLAWRRRSKWEPDITDIPDAPPKVAAMATGVLLVLLWYDGGASLGFPPLPKVALLSLFAAIAGLLVYVVLNATYLCEQQFAQTTKKVAKRKIIGGLWLTRVARERRKDQEDLSKILLEAGSNPNAVWPPLSRGISQVLLIAAYMILVVGGSMALAAVALLVQTRTSG